MGGIRVDQLAVRYGDREVLEDLSLDLEPGTLLSILGESATGKTTLIRAVAGLCPIRAGRIEIGGTEVAGPGGSLSPEERGVGIVFQDLALWPHMTVLENVGFPLEGRLGRAQRMDRAREVLEAVRLPGGHQRRPHEISGGERRRVALARALASQPQVLLLDEPFSDLQLSLRDELMNLVWDFARERSVAVIHATHIQEEALAFADRLGILHGGKIIQEGTPEEVYHGPSTSLAARLLGEVSVLRGKRIGPTTVRTALGELTVPEGEGDLVVGVRPEALRIDGVGSVEGKVCRRRFLGGRTLLEVDLDGTRLWATGDKGIRIGDTVRVEVDPKGLHPFPGERP